MTATSGANFPVPALRTLLRANAIFASATGLTAIALTGPVARLIGIEQHRLVSATGVGLLLFAVGLMIASGAKADRLVSAGRLISLADALWVAASVYALAFAELAVAGNLMISAISAVVAAFATLQLAAAGRVDEQSDLQLVEVSGVLDGSPEDVWAVVIDHEAYGQLAPNLSKVIPTGPDGPELTRRCWDTRGRHWDEACVLWENGVRYAVAVDTAAMDYPYPLDSLRGEWAVRPIGADQTEVTVRFEIEPSPGLAGAAFATAMSTGAKPILRHVMKGWQELTVNKSAATRPSPPGTDSRRSP